MDLYLYRIGTQTPMACVKNAAYYTADAVIAEDGTVYGTFADDCELSSREDCTETLRADWQEEHPTEQKRIEELEALIAYLLYGGDAE